MRKKRNNRKEIVKMATVKGKLWLKCRNCGHKWYPDARKWRNKNPIEKKVLYCPQCNVKNVVPKVVVKYLLEKANQETEYGFE